MSQKINLSNKLSREQAKFKNCFKQAKMEVLLKLEDAECGQAISIILLKNLNQPVDYLKIELNGCLELSQLPAVLLDTHELALWIGDGHKSNKVTGIECIETIYTAALCQSAHLMIRYDQNDHEFEVIINAGQFIGIGKVPVERMLGYFAPWPIRYPRNKPVTPL